MHISGGKIASGGTPEGPSGAPARNTRSRRVALRATRIASTVAVPATDAGPQINAVVLTTAAEDVSIGLLYLRTEI